MIRQTVSLPASLLSSRAAAAELVQSASRYSSLISLCRGQKAANVKSMLGLLSLLSGGEGELTLLVDGEDEQ